MGFSPGSMAPVVVRLKSDASTPVTDLLNVTVKSTEDALVGLAPVRVMDETVGGAPTVRSTEPLGFPALGVWVVVTPEVEFGLGPRLLLVTLKVTVQVPVVPVPGIVIPVKLFRPLPAARLL